MGSIIFGLYNRVNSVEIIHHTLYLPLKSKIDTLSKFIEHQRRSKSILRRTMSSHCKEIRCCWSWFEGWAVWNVWIHVNQLPSCDLSFFWSRNCDRISGPQRSHFDSGVSSDICGRCTLRLSSRQTKTLSQSKPLSCTRDGMFEWRIWVEKS